VTGLPFAPLALGVALLLVAALWGLERWRPWREEFGAEADSLLPPRPRCRQSSTTRHGLRDGIARVQAALPCSAALRPWRRLASRSKRRKILSSCVTTSTTAPLLPRYAAQKVHRHLRAFGIERRVEGGPAGLRRVGLPVPADPRAPLPLMRQVMLVAGGLALVGVVGAKLVMARRHGRLPAGARPGRHALDRQPA
jgi:hypothetical protein